MWYGGTRNHLRQGAKEVSQCGVRALQVSVGQGVFGDEREVPPRANPFFHRVERLVTFVTPGRSPPAAPRRAVPSGRAPSGDFR
jgi:hypothetical protein